VCCSVLQCVAAGGVHRVPGGRRGIYFVHCLQHTATHCNKLQHSTEYLERDLLFTYQLGTCPAVCCSVLQCVAVCCSVCCRWCTSSTCSMTRYLLFTLTIVHHSVGEATHCNTLQYTAKHCITLQHTASRCNTKTTLMWYHGVGEAQPQPSVLHGVAACCSVCTFCNRIVPEA